MARETEKPPKGLVGQPLSGNITSRREQQLTDGVDRDRFLDAARRLAAKDRNGLADPEDVATELGIELSEVTEVSGIVRLDCRSDFRDLLLRKSASPSE
jgi:hypothetical protein